MDNENPNTAENRAPGRLELLLTSPISFFVFFILFIAAIIAYEILHKR